ncbi:MAG: biotin/lipoyl-binding protein [Tannerellaceae bacterium]|jgi:biotin carboxyl carrier protein|nr:biotin/lipoyl-binding protein [Tannerellaceae bacterium]
MKKFKIKINGSEYKVRIHSVENNQARLTVNDVDFEVEVEGLTTNPTRMSTKEISAIQPATPLVKPVAASGSAKPLKAPLPGVIKDIKVGEGDTVKAGQVVVVLEAMKMENNIESDRDGTVEKIHTRKEETVLEGDVLLTIK